MEEYWVYHNWQAEKGGKARIHRANCSSCNNGQGVHHKASPRINDEWLGPFSTREEALTKAINTKAANLYSCRKCNPWRSSDMPKELINML